MLMPTNFNSTQPRNNFYPYKINFNELAIITSDASLKTVDNVRNASATYISRISTNCGNVVTSETIFCSPDLNVNIQHLESMGLINGIYSLFNRGYFNDIICISDNVDALHIAENLLFNSNQLLPHIRFFWVKAHEGYLVNEVADSMLRNESLKRFATSNTCSLYPNGEPFCEFIPGSELIYGINRPYSKQEQKPAFINLIQ